MKKFFLLISICAASQLCLAQSQHKIDSLKQVLANAKEDTSKEITLNALSREFWQTGDHDQGKKYAGDALTLEPRFIFPS